MKNILSVKNIIKTYPGVIAINDVSFDVEEGEIHALIGENGAGKSTLIKVLSGAIVPDSGTALGATFIKLIGLPLVFLPFAYKLGFAPSEMVAILIMLASPTTVSCYVMAKNMDNDDILTSNVIVLTTLLSSVTLTLWIFILRSIGCI